MTIASLIPNEIKVILEEIEGLGFSLCLIGGGTRDYFLNKTLSHDLDFELRNKDISHLILHLKNKNLPFSELPYGIVRVPYQEFDLEFSTPRLEIQKVGNKTHHHFEAKLDSNLSYEEAFKRRDFTMNAIGMVFNFAQKSECLVDPYNGVSDLGMKVLKEVSNDFFLDSVRFLRLIRFGLKYNFSVSPSIENKIDNFDLSKLSIHHFIEEMMKSKRSGEFVNKFNEYIQTYKLKVPSDFHFLKLLTFSTENSREDLLVTAFLQNKELALKLLKFLSLPEKKLKDLTSFYNSFVALKNTSREDIMLLTAAPFDVLKDEELLKDMKNLEEKKEWRKYFSETLPLSWDDWESVSVSPDELEGVPLNKRSYLRFYKAAKKSFKS